ncbi:COG4648 family protein [Acidihalobacter prosperus]|uniref:Ketosynthase n=1 Tax=Acidihalobacter prosperus TaxID=160660 RepID=A0A1A6C4E3_9GAMM|nr:hypothetical protein [Acidihalobacter prosperus]OBS09410.1 hypothetical protein Thpro_021738 [Acidihalobacter prosperus]
MRRWPILLLAYPIVAHLGVVYGTPVPAIILLIALLSLSFRQAMVRRERTHVLILTLYAVGTLTMIDWLGLRGALYLPPVMANATVAYWFARSLMPGQTDLITRIAAQIEPEMTPDLTRYCRRVSWAWACFSAALALATAAIAIAAPIEIWSWFTNFAIYLLIAGFFIGEWLTRIWVLGRGRTAGPLRILKSLPHFDYRRLLYA